jgi:glycosyltransferase involved in cell wall biosynthesis
MTKITICTPCFNEAGNIRRCHETIKKIFDVELPGYEREHIFADNCSTDGTVEMLREIAASDKSAKVILNARNFGIIRSSMNGILSATGDAVFMFVPADLQDPPEIMPQFVRLWEQGYEVVYGTRQSREESALMAFLRRSYYRILRRLSSLDLPMNLSDFQLLDKRIIEAMRQFDDFYPFVRGMPFMCTDRTIGVPYSWKARTSGVSKNRIFQLIDQGLNGIISTTQLPTRLALFGGVILASLSIVYAFISAVFSLIDPPSYTVAGIRTLIAGMFLFNGLLLLVVGVLGEYVLAIHSQVRRQPRVVERERINFDAKTP